jgi:hypothetical protein
MSHEAWVMIALALIANAFVIVGGYVNIKTTLTRIETDLKWVKGNCPSCQQISDHPLK